MRADRLWLGPSDAGLCQPLALAVPPREIEVGPLLPPIDLDLIPDRSIVPARRVGPPPDTQNGLVPIAIMKDPHAVRAREDDLRVASFFVRRPGCPPHVRGGTDPRSDAHEKPWNGWLGV